MNYQIRIRDIEPIRVAFMRYKGIVTEANQCATLLTEASMFSSIKIRENSVFIDVDDDRKIFENTNKWLLENNIHFEAIEIVQPSL